MAIRRNARLRREYLYKKSLEGKAKEEYERKEKLRVAMQSGKPIPTELRKDAEALKQQIDLEDDRTAVPKSSIDDEYANAGARQPRICITTSRDPSSRLRQFAAEVRLLFPASQRMNRGNTTTREVVEAAKSADFTDIILVQETRGEPDAMLICHLPYGPTLHCSLSNAVLRHDLENVGPVSEAAPHLIFNNFQSTLGSRIMNILKHLYPVPKEDSARIMTYSNDSDYISFRHHTYTKEAPGAAAAAAAAGGGGGGAVGAGGGGGGGEKNGIKLIEIGPRFELHPFQIKLGTLEQTDAETEWVLRPYMNTARKRQAL